MARRIARWTRVSAFVFLSSVVMVTASERVYWYLGGATAETLVLTPLFYVIPALVGLWTLGSGPSSRLHQIVLGGAVFGFIVEGVLTTEIYLDGPLPAMAALFVGWHGLLSVVSFWYLARRWLLDRQRHRLAIGAGLIGAYWGVWSIVYSLPPALTDFEDPYEIMNPAGFAVYALIVGAVFAAAHWLLGFVWPDRFAPGRWGGRGIVALCAGYAALAVLPVVIWAPIKLGVLLGGTLWLLSKSRESTPSEPSAIASLQGRVRPGDVAILMIMPLVAIATYGVMWSLDLSVVGLQTVYGVGTGIQIAAGLVAYIWAAYRSLRPSEQLTPLAGNASAEPNA
ncbi:MAG: hypothetical protein R2823_03910 [Acidimicrobiia bacterium]